MDVRRLVAGLVALVVLIAGCVHRVGPDDTGLRIMVPNPPGSGYDLTARILAKSLQDAGIIRDVQVFNVAGGHGTVGLHRLVYERGNDQLLLLMGLGLIGALRTRSTQAQLTDTIPIARLIEEPNVVVVRRDSPYRSLSDLLQDWRADPTAVSIGGGSVPGGPDHLATMLFAQAAGIVPREARYVRYDGGGSLLAAILSQEVSVAISGLGEYATHIRTGQLRVLAVTSANRVPGLDAPTLREAGVDVVFTNWRGIVAPPGLTQRQVSALLNSLDRLHESPEWQEAMRDNGWTDAYLTGDAFAAFVRDESQRVDEVLDSLGLVPDST